MVDPLKKYWTELQNPFLKLGGGLEAVVVMYIGQKLGGSMA